MRKKVMALILSAVLGAAMLAGCGSSAQKSAQTGNTSAKSAVASSALASAKSAAKSSDKEKTKMNVAVLKGPTGIGAAKLIDESKNNESKNSYDFTIAASPDEITGKLVSGELDAAAVPTNLAAVLYNKTQGKVQIAAINTLGVLYLLDDGSTSIQSVADLEGKTIAISGQGSVPEYALEYILKANGVKANLEFMQEHAQVAQALAGGKVSIAVLPEPQVTAVEMKNDKIVTALDLTKEWEAACKKNGDDSDSRLAMGCVVARKDFIDKNKDAFNTFLAEYQDSISYTENASDVSKLVEKYAIMDSAKAAEKAIPNCNIVYYDGKDMKTMITNFYKVLYDANPASVGGKLPGDDFYYINEQ